MIQRSKAQKVKYRVQDDTVLAYPSIALYRTELSISDTALGVLCTTPTEKLRREGVGVKGWYRGLGGDECDT